MDREYLATNEEERKYLENAVKVLNDNYLVEVKGKIMVSKDKSFGFVHIVPGVESSIEDVVKREGAKDGEIVSSTPKGIFVKIKGVIYGIGYMPLNSG
jgi:hypothetical protein